jgi:two-component system CheB/CheR fusion protein
MMAHQNLLLVEDDTDGQEVVNRILRHHHISHTACGSAEEALQLIESGNIFTGAIVDLALPGMDGWTLLRTLRGNPSTAQLPCVAITAFHSPEVAIKAIEAGFAAYFPKPLEATSFVRELERVIE